MTETELDAAHAAMSAAPEDDAARLRFYERLADTELFLLLETDPVDETVSPRIFGLEDGDFALAFDTEERLAEFAIAPVPNVALPGRVVARALAGQGVGLALNPGVAASAHLLPAAALEWLAEALDHGPQAAEGRPAEFVAPGELPPELLSALDRRLSRLGGFASRAYLVGTVGANGVRGHLLVLEGARAEDEPALAKAIAEAVTFSGLEAGILDVTFLPEGDAAIAKIAPVALRFDIPEPPAQPVREVAATAPGMDPTRPPKLR